MPERMLGSSRQRATLAVFVAATFAVAAVLALPLGVVSGLRSLLPGHAGPPVGLSLGEPTWLTLEPPLGILGPTGSIGHGGPGGVLSSGAGPGASGAGFLPGPGPARPNPPTPLPPGEPTDTPTTMGPAPQVPASYGPMTGEGDAHTLSKLFRAIARRLPPGVKRAIADAPHPRRAVAGVLAHVARGLRPGSGSLTRPPPWIKSEAKAHTSVAVHADAKHRHKKH